MLPVLFTTISEIIRNTFFLLGMVSNVNSFPHPLSSEEEQEYLDRYKAGSEEARNILIERNLRLVAHIVKKYSNARKESEDLISIGTVGLIKAITTFDQDKGIRLATYAAKCIENEILSQRKHLSIRTDTRCWKVHPGQYKVLNLIFQKQYDNIYL